MKKYRVVFNTEVIIEISEDLLASIDDNWRETFYSSYRTNTDIADHLAYNMGIQNLPLGYIDGFADRKDTDAKVIDFDIETSEIEEIKSEEKENI